MSPRLAPEPDPVPIPAGAAVRSLLSRLQRGGGVTVRQGTGGERIVAEVLGELDERWKVLNDVPVGSHGGLIDHLVIGPAGVFTVTDRHHPGSRVWSHGEAVTVDGELAPYVRNARFAAKRASRALTQATGFLVEAIGLVVLAAKEQQVALRQQPRDGSVVLLRRQDLEPWLDGQSVILDDERVEKVWHKARLPWVWTAR